MSRRDAFTLIEMLAVMLLVSILLGVALDFYVDLSRQATRATELTRGVRRAHAILDRVAADVEHAMLVTKPDERDPLAHPWLFLGESLYAVDGSDRLKFVRRTTPRSTEAPASPLAVVAYTLRPSEETEDAYTLYRWSSPELPDTLDREFPFEGDPADLLLADGLESFAVRFLAGGNEWQTGWDSSQLSESSRLPLAVEIEVAMADDPALSDDEFGDEAVRYRRRVPLPLRPLDLEALLTPEEEDEDGEGAGEDDIDPSLTVADCLDPGDVDYLAQVFGVSESEAISMYDNMADQPWADAVAQAPELANYGTCL